MLTSRLGVHLAEAAAGAPRGALPAQGLEGVSNDVEAIKPLPDRARGLISGAYSEATSEMFLVALPIVAVALVIGLFLKELPLGTRESAAHVEEEAAPVGDEAAPAEEGPVVVKGGARAPDPA